MGIAMCPNCASEVREKDIGPSFGPGISGYTNLESNIRETPGFEYAICPKCKKKLKRRQGDTSTSWQLGASEALDEPPPG